MAAELVQLVRRGRPSAADLAARADRHAERAADLQDELTAARAEADALVVACLPLAHRLYFAAQVIGPEMSQTAIALIARLERHGRQNGRAA